MTKGFRWNALRDWVKVARDLPRTRGAYPDGPLVALVFAFCKAAEQPEPGTFDSVPILRAILDATGSKRGRHVPFLIEHGDVMVCADGRAVLPNWKTFQDEGKSTDRVKKHRAERSSSVSGNGAETFQGAFHETASETHVERLAGAPPRRESPSETRTPDGVRRSPNVDALSGADNVPARFDDDPDDDLTTLQKLAESLTGESYGFARDGTWGVKVATLLRKHGRPSVEREWRRIAAEERGMPTIRQLVLGADNALNPLPSSGKPMSDAERKEAEIQAAIAQIKAETAGARA